MEGGGGERGRGGRSPLFLLLPLSIFEGVSETDITKWCRNNNKTISSTRKTSTLKDAIDIPNLFAASPTDIDSILIPIPGCKFVLTGDDVQSKNLRTDSHGLAYEFCFPITTI